MPRDAILEAVEALELAWQGVEDGDYNLDDDAKAEAKRLLDTAISASEEAVKLLIGNLS